MGGRLTKAATPELFAFKVSSPVVARRFRNHCHRRGLIMGAALERMIIKFLIEEGDVESEEAIHEEEESK